MHSHYHRMIIANDTRQDIQVEAVLVVHLFRDQTPSVTVEESFNSATGGLSYLPSFGIDSKLIARPLFYVESLWINRIRCQCVVLHFGGLIPPGGAMRTKARPGVYIGETKAPVWILKLLFLTVSPSMATESS